MIHLVRLCIGTEGEFHGIVAADLHHVVFESLRAESAAGVGVRGRRPHRQIEILRVHCHADETAFIRDQRAFQIGESRQRQTWHIFVFGNDPVQLGFPAVRKKSDHGICGLEGDTAGLFAQFIGVENRTKPDQKKELLMHCASSLIIVPRGSVPP